MIILFAFLYGAAYQRKLVSKLTKNADACFAFWQLVLAEG